MTSRVTCPIDNRLQQHARKYLANQLPRHCTRWLTRRFCMIYSFAIVDDNQNNGSLCADVPMSNNLTWIDSICLLTIKIKCEWFIDLYINNKKMPIFLPLVSRGHQQLWIYVQSAIFRSSCTQMAIVTVDCFLSKICIWCRYIKK